MLEYTMLVQDLMRTDVVTIEVDATMDDAYARMLQTGVDSVIVTRGSPPRKTGILTDSDVKRAMYGYSEPLSTFYVDEFMSRPLKTVNPDTTLSKAVEVFVEQDINHLVVTEKMQLEGVLTLPAIAKAYDEIVKRTREAASKGPSWRRKRDEGDEAREQLPEDLREEIEAEVRAELEDELREELEEELREEIEDELREAVRQDVRAELREENQ